MTVGLRIDNAWPRELHAASLVDQLVLASRLLGANRAVANQGGGNTSAKGIALDHRGREVKTMWVKASGSDLATVRREGFAALRLDDLLELFERDSMSDGEMISYLSRCQLDPAAPRPSIETLLHAFVPSAHVHHTHPDAINVLASSRYGEEIVAECFEGRAAWVPYIRPGFELAKQVGALARSGTAEFVVLGKHGLVVWGDTAEETYRQTIDVVNQAIDFAKIRVAATSPFGGPACKHASSQVLPDLLPVVRGALSSERSKVIVVDTSERALEFVSSHAAPELATTGAACPDHLVNTKRLPLWVPYDPSEDTTDALAARVRAMAAAYREDYREYVKEYGDENIACGDPDARIVLIQGLGIVAAGSNTAAAHLSRDLYERAVEVMGGAHALGGFVSLTPRESFDVEYWDLERYKLALLPPPRELEGKVALITGAAGGIGRAISARLAAAGAAIVAFDLDGGAATEVVAPYGRAGVAVTGDVTSEADVAAAFDQAAKAFGGVDIVVSNAGIASSAAIEETSLADWERNQTILSTGYFLVARQAFAVLRRQGTGGAIVFIGSKNAVAAGKNASAYSASKAAELHLARCLAEEGGPSGIRVNTVNPDAVLQGSKIWNSSWREERAASYGISPEALEEHYRKRTTLGVNIVPDDVAEAVIHFASDHRSSKSTGNFLNVDGGVAAAYPR